MAVAHFPGFPVRFSGFAELHAAFPNESRTRCRWMDPRTGNPGQAVFWGLSGVHFHLQDVPHSSKACMGNPQSNFSTASVDADYIGGYENALQCFAGAGCANGGGADEPDRE
jgi:hypothetical protein